MTNLPIQIDVHLIKGRKVMQTRPHKTIKAWAIVKDDLYQNEPSIAVITKKYPFGVFPGVSIGGIPVFPENDFA